MGDPELPLDNTADVDFGDAALDKHDNRLLGCVFLRRILASKQPIWLSQDT